MLLRFMGDRAPQRRPRAEQRGGRRGQRVSLFRSLRTRRGRQVSHLLVVAPITQSVEHSQRAELVEAYSFCCSPFCRCLPHFAAAHTTMDPEKTFSIILRLLIEVTPKNVGSGNFVPVLFILHAAMHLRNIVGEHSNADTGCLAQYVQKLFETPDEKEFARVFATALKVDSSCIDIKDRVVVCWGLLLVAHDCVFLWHGVLCGGGYVQATYDRFVAMQL